MEQALEQIREQQKATWNKFSSGWKKWDDVTMNFLASTGDAIISSLHLKATDKVLDIATGTGEPGLTIARIARNGKVVGTDLAEGMLVIARDNAKAKGITNYETIACDVSQLPFADNTFDAVSCRFGFMFFPDMQQAANEIKRVLKPAGRIATSIWGAPAKNPWAAIMLAPVNEVMQIPPPPQGAPGLFRCAPPGMIEDLFSKAGLKNITSQEISDQFDFHSEDTFWEYMNDVVAPVVAAMSKATPEQKEIVRSKVFANIHQMNPSGGVKLNYSSQVISAEK